MRYKTQNCLTFQSVIISNLLHLIPSAVNEYDTFKWTLPHHPFCPFVWCFSRIMRGFFQLPFQSRGGRTPNFFCSWWFHLSRWSNFFWKNLLHITIESHWRIRWIYQENLYEGHKEVHFIMSQIQGLCNKQRDIHANAYTLWVFIVRYGGKCMNHNIFIGNNSSMGSSAFPINFIWVLYDIHFEGQLCSR